MKKILPFILIGFLGCDNPVDDLEIGEPFSQTEAIQDIWTLSSVRQIDELDLNKPFTDLSYLFVNGQLSISESSFSFSLDSGPDYFGTASSWEFDDETFPENVVLDGLTNLKLGAPVRESDDQLVLKLERTCENRVISSYEYTFTRN